MVHGVAKAEAGNENKWLDSPLIRLIEATLTCYRLSISPRQSH